VFRRWRLVVGGEWDGFSLFSSYYERTVPSWFGTWLLLPPHITLDSGFLHALHCIHCADFTFFLLRSHSLTHFLFFLLPGPSTHAHTRTHTQHTSGGCFSHLMCVVLGGNRFYEHKTKEGIHWMKWNGLFFRASRKKKAVINDDCGTNEIMIMIMMMHDMAYHIIDLVWLLSWVLSLRGME